MLAVELVAAVMMGGDESSSMLVADAIAPAALQCEYDDVLMRCCDEESRGESEAKPREGKASLLASTLEHRERAREIGHPARPMARGGRGGHWPGIHVASAANWCRKEE